MSTTSTITRIITKPSKKTVISHQEPKVTKQEQEENIKKMDDQLFQQFFQALASDPVPASTEASSSTSSTFIVDELQQQQQQQHQDQSWLSSPEWSFAMGTGQQSVHSTPEIATPQDMFLTSPTTEHVAFDKSGFIADLDVSALLSSSLFDVPQPQQEQVATSPVPTAAPSPAVAPATPGGNDFHAALAALATVTQSPVVQEQDQSKSTTKATSPVIDVTPTFSARKRKSDEASEFNMSPADEAAIKRQKNTDAARRSRLRKAMKMDSLEKRVSELEKTNTTLLLRAAVLESEKSSLLAKEASYEQRIKALEAQLAQAHHSLAGLGSSR